MNGQIFQIHERPFSANSLRSIRTSAASQARQFDTDVEGVAGSPDRVGISETSLPLSEQERLSNRRGMRSRMNSSAIAPSPDKVGRIDHCTIQSARNVGIGMPWRSSMAHRVDARPVSCSDTRRLDGHVASESRLQYVLPSGCGRSSHAGRLIEGRLRRWEPCVASTACCARRAQSRRQKLSGIGRVDESGQR
jgi:hypothetical protein